MAGPITATLNSSRNGPTHPRYSRGSFQRRVLLMLRSGTSSNRCHKKKSSRYEKRACGSASLACAAGSELEIASTVKSAPVNKQVASAKKTIAIQSTLKVYTNGASAPIGLSAVYRRVRLVSVAMSEIAAVSSAPHSSKTAICRASGSWSSIQCDSARNSAIAPVVAIIQSAAHIQRAKKPWAARPTAGKTILRDAIQNEPATKAG